jgi:hypothetical protein
MHVFILNVSFIVIGTLAETLDGKVNAILPSKSLAVQNLILDIRIPGRDALFLTLHLPPSTISYSR